MSRQAYRDEFMESMVAERLLTGGDAAGMAKAVTLCHSNKNAELILERVTKDVANGKIWPDYSWLASA